MDKIKTVKIKNPDGSVSEETYTISVDAKNVDMANGKELQETIGTIDIDNDGNISQQLKNFKQTLSSLNEIKVNKQDIVDNLETNENTKVLSAKQGNNLNKLKATIYNTIADMKADNSLKTGMTALTLGYYDVNDGGGATYKIRNKTQDDLNENGFVQFIDNNVVAELIIENNTVNIRQLGARSQIINDKFDIAPYLDKYNEYLKTIQNRVKLYIPSGVWYCSGYNLINDYGFDIFGDRNFSFLQASGTIITSLNDNQNYVLKIGSATERTHNWSIRNILFSTADFGYNSNVKSYFYGTVKHIQDEVLSFINTTFGFTDNLFFININGRALKMTNVWETYNGLLNFRKISSHDKSIWCFGTGDTTLTDNISVSASTFEKVMFEAVHGDLIETEYRSKLCNCHFGVINFEDFKLETNGAVYTAFTDENIPLFDDNAAIHNCIFKIGYGGNLNECVIDAIELNNISSKYHTYNGNNYVYDVIFGLNEYPSVSVSVDNITTMGMTKNCRIIRRSSATGPGNTIFVFGNITNSSKKNFYMDVKGIKYIKCDSDLVGYDNSGYYAISNDLNPFYKSIYKDMTANERLYYDENSLNNLKLCVKADKTSPNCKIICGGENILVRAKIPVGETVSLSFYYSSVFRVLNMEGTGNFENYTLELSSKFAIGDKMDVKLSSATSSLNCLLDYYKFY